MNKPIRYALLVLTVALCAYMAHEHEAWASFWWFVWQVPLVAGCFWSGVIYADLCQMYQEERALDEQEQVESDRPLGPTQYWRED